MKKKIPRILKYAALGILALVLARVVIVRFAGENAIPVDTDEVKCRDITETVSGIGAVRPVTEVKISPEVSGKVTDLMVQEGDSVAAGDLLAAVRPDQFRLALEIAQADENSQRISLAASKAALAGAKVNQIRVEQEYERQKALYDLQAISAAEFEKSLASKNVTGFEVESAEQNVLGAQYRLQRAVVGVRSAREDLGRTRILAPVAGIVSKLNVEVGENVVGTSQMAGTEVMRIANLDSMEVLIEMNENDIVRIHPGDSALVDVDAYNTRKKMFKGVVTHIASTAQDEMISNPDKVTVFQVRVQLLRDSYMDLMESYAVKYPFKPGMTANVEIIVARRYGVVSVPISSVTLRAAEGSEAKDPGNPEAVEDSKDFGRPAGAGEADFIGRRTEDLEESVFIVEAGRARLRRVITGINDFGFIEILEGLEQGEKIVMGPYLTISKLLRDGQEVTGN